MDAKIKEQEKLFNDELKKFFDCINQDNSYLPEKYNELINLLKKYRELINDKDRVIHLYTHFFEIYNLDDWQESIYGDVVNRLIGLSADFQKIDL